jgi:hydroxyethylthiazole kinase-like uncharacterized protein yjeF
MTVAIALSREQVRRVDRIAIDEYGIPGIVLMENAARAVADAAAELILIHVEKLSAGRVSVICGGGNNGGDGYAVARHLHNAGIHVSVFAVHDPEKLNGDALINRRIVEKMKIECVDVLDDVHLKSAELEWRKAHVIVDSILGTGFSGELKPHIAAVIAAINAATYVTRGPYVLAVDLPSGLDCDSGMLSKPTICAHFTVTFVAPKIGFDTIAAKSVLGQTLVADIGAPPEIVERVLRES